MEGFNYLTSDNIDIESEKFLVAKRLFKSADYNGALRIYLDLLSTSSISYKLYYDIGRCYYRLENFDEAEIHFKNSIMLENTKNLSYVYLGNIEFFKNNISKAIEFWTYASVHNPSDETICINLANSYNSKEMFFQSTIYYLKYLKYSKNKNSINYIEIKNSLEADEKNCRDLYKKASKVVDIDDISIKINALQYGLKKFPLNFDANYMLGKLYYEEKNYSDALKFFMQAYNIDSKSTDILEMLFLSNISLKDFKTAYCCLKRALRLAIGHQKMYLEIIQNINKLEATIDKNDFEKHIVLAKQYYENNDYFMALFEYENALILNPLLSQSLYENIELLKRFINPEINIIKLSLEKGGIYYSEKDYINSNKHFSKVMLLADEKSAEYKIAKSRLVNV